MCDACCAVRRDEKARIDMTKGLPPLPPDLRFEPLVDCVEAFEFSFAVKKEALGPHIRARWPWDEEYQRRVHKSHFAEKPFSAIYHHDTAMGTVSWLVERRSRPFWRILSAQPISECGTWITYSQTRAGAR